MNTRPAQFVPLHGPMMVPPNPKAALACMGIALLLTALVACLA